MKEAVEVNQSSHSIQKDSKFKTGLTTKNRMLRIANMLNAMLYLNPTPSRVRSSDLLRQQQTPEDPACG